MPVGPGYVPVIAHVNDGEVGNETVFKRPSVELEQRTDALKSFVEDELEVELDAVSVKADQNETDVAAIQADTTPADLITHVADTTQHTDFADSTEVKTGVNTTKVVSPDTYAAAESDRLKHMYNAIVGDVVIANGGTGVTHATLAAALAAASAGWKILVTKDQFITATLNVTANNIEIEFRRGASIKQGGAVTPAINVTGNDFYLDKARIEQFTTCINIDAAANRTMLRDTRFKTTTTEVSDAGTATSELGSITE